MSTEEPPKAEEEAPPPKDEEEPKKDADEETKVEKKDDTEVKPKEQDETEEKKPKEEAKAAEGEEPPKEEEDVKKKEQQEEAAAPSKNEEPEKEKKREIIPRPFPEALPHSKLKEILPNIWFLQGTVNLNDPIPMQFSRNMTVLKQGDDDLFLINPIRVDEKTLNEIDGMGTVKYLVKVAGSHGQDDPFYKARYPDATVWAPRDSLYFTGTDMERGKLYFEADRYFDNDTKTPDEFPLQHSKIIYFETSKIPEVLILYDSPYITDKGSKVIFSGDSLQNYCNGRDAYTGFWSSRLMYLVGFMKPYNIGPGWLMQAKVNPKELAAVLEHKFDHLIPVHGEPCLNQAYEKYTPTIMAIQPKEATPPAAAATAAATTTAGGASTASTSS